MKKILLCLALVLITIACNKEEEDTNPAIANNSTAEVENTLRTVANLPINFFKPKNIVAKGIVILGSGNNPQNPTPGNINDGYLIELSQSLAVKGYACAIVQYRDQPFVGNNFENFNSNRDMLIADFNAVGNALRAESSLERNKLVFGGSSYSANCLVSHNAWGNGMTDIRGVIAIMGSCALDTAKNQKIPIIACACNGEPFGTNYGLGITQNITNASVKIVSFGITDNSCSGHNTSNNWITTIVQKVNGNWLL